MKKEYCEYCGNPKNLEIHHIKTRGAGGKDIPENLIVLCHKCHQKAQQYKTNRYVLIQIVALREGKDKEEICNLIDIPIPDKWPRWTPPKETPSLEQVIQTIINLEEKEDDCKWKFGELVKALIDTGITINWLASQIRRSGAYIRARIKTFEVFSEESTRVPELSWQHHRICANTDKPYEWIQKAAENQWSTRELEQAIKEGKPKKDEIEEAKKVLTKVQDILAKNNQASEFLRESLLKLLTGEEENVA